MIIGREKEIDQLNRAFESKASEFVVVYGRRRIGKTFLIRESFKNKFTFQYTGIYNVSNKTQLAEFHRSLINQGLKSDTPLPKDWFEAFSSLTTLVDSSSDKKKIIFIDELPWMETRNSRFLNAFEHFWNGWAATRKDILLIVCGSASSWIINKIFRNKGGLYNRVTGRIALHQFSLYECEQLVKSMKLPMSRNMIIETYMVIGGIPYYWTKLRPDRSSVQNINDLFFRTGGELHNEFKYIYSSMFSNPDKYMKVVSALATNKSGMTRDGIIQKGKLESNGQLSKILEDLIECGFVRKYCHTDKKLRDALYQLVDCYTLFYFQFIRNSHGVDEGYWQKIQNTPLYHAWSGVAFERVCLLHTRQIKSALGISGILANIFSWHIRKNDFHPGVQIDLLLERSDNVINVCEIKYAPRGFSVTSNFIDDLNLKINVFSQYLSKNKYVQPVLITSNGVVPNKHSGEIGISIDADQLFIP